MASAVLALASFTFFFDAMAQPLPMKIRITIHGETATATLDNTAAARDFAALLPLDLVLTDYAGIERIADLPRKLSTQGAPAGVAPAAGDLAYYAPWGNVAFFVGAGVYAKGLVRLGRVDTGLHVLQGKAPLRALMERVAD